MKTGLSSCVYYLAALWCVFMLGGCMVGPKYVRPETAADTGEGYFNSGEHSQDVNELDKSYRWWERFGDATVSQLVREALKNNYDVKAAAARVLQAEAIFGQVRGRELPDISYSLSRTRTKSSFNFGTGRISPLTTTFSQGYSASYILDLFGKLRRAERSAWADVLGAKANRQALINSVIATVVTARINIATLQKQLAIARANTKSRQLTLEIVERRYSHGLVGPVDVRLARENLAVSKAAEPSLELSLARARYGLDVILGRRPGSSPDLPATLADLPNLEPVPIGLPASLLDRRPDLVAAEAALRSANEQVGVSIAQLFPDLTLTGNLGRSADRWRDLWIPETEIYSTVSRLAQPLFKGGRLVAQVKASKARYEELAANYAGVVLKALKEVEDALVSEEKLRTQLKHIEVEFSEAKAAENLSRQRYQRGVESILAVLESERRRRAAENELTVLKGRIWATRVSLFLALGGDWGCEEKIQKEREYSDGDKKREQIRVGESG